tara:strand:+ start:24924 stop:25802 length:879 start_codon:yes stop_codon:yes gene_type:complete
MLPDNFDFALIPVGMDLELSEIGMLASDIENIDSSIMSWVKDDLRLSAITNEGFVETPVLWQVPERAYQIKHNKSLRDDSGAIKLPVVSIERTGIAKDPARKGGFQAQRYSDRGDGRTGRMVIAREIVEDKTRNFAVAAGTRTNTSGSLQQWSPRVNKRIVIKTLSVPIPIYINVEYKIYIKTEYQQQMNDLIAPFMTRTGQINSFIMRRNGHMYEAFIDQGFTHNNNVSNLGEDLRSFSSEISIRVLGYLIGEGKNDDRNIVRIDENVVDYLFPQEGIVTEDEDGFFQITS